MNIAFPSLTRRVALFALIVAVSACALPRSGPKINEIIAGSKTEGGEVNVVFVTNEVAKASNLNVALGFSSSFINAGASATDSIYPGDTLSITIWENVENPIFGIPGQKMAILQEIQVNQKGTVFIPYAGLLKAAGNTPEQLRLLITRNLDLQTPDPQVEVRRVAGDGSSVSVIGGVGLQGVYPIVASTTRLSSMLATAGGVTINPDIAQVAVRRGGKTGRIFLQDLYDDPKMDISLRSNDKIIVEEDRRTFTALGATGTQARVPFPQGRISVIDALAEVGGLNGAVADPTGIFIFRREPVNVAQRVLGHNQVAGNEPFAYVIDLTKPSGIFIAKEFQIRDDDTIYITEAPFVGWAKILEATTGTLGFVNSVARTVDIFSE